MRTDDPPPPTPLDHLAHSLRARASVPSGSGHPRRHPVDGGP